MEVEVGVFLGGAAEERHAGEGAGLGAIVGEAVVVLAGDHDVAHAGALKETGPFVGVEVDRIEGLGVLVIFGLRDLEEVAGPFVAAEDRIGAPMDEDAELGVFEPLKAVGSTGGGG